jgi:hypothetical protein
VIGTIVAKTNANATILDLTGVSGLTVESWNRAGVSYRERTVSFDDVPGETVVSAVRAAENMVVTFALDRDNLSDALDALEVITEAVCADDLRTFKLVVTYNSDRVETWTVLRPADSSPADMDPAAGQGVVRASLTFRVNPNPTVTYADTYES